MSYEFELVSTTDVDITSLLPLSKLQTRVPSVITIDDDLYNLYIPTAIKLLESAAEITLIEKTFNLNLTDWPCRQYAGFTNIRFMTTPVTECVHIKYYDTNGDQQTLDSDLIQPWLSKTPPEIWIPTVDLPSLSSEISKAVEVQFIAGYDDVNDFSPGSKLAILELVAFWYQNREAYGRIPVEGAQARVFQTMIDMLRWRIYP